MDLNWNNSVRDENGCCINFPWGLIVVIKTNDFFNKFTWRCHLFDREKDLHLHSDFCYSESEAQGQAERLLNQRDIILKAKGLNEAA